MKVLKAIRANSWWEYKIPIFLAMGYAAALHTRMPVFHIVPWLLLLLLSLVVGAAYVSLINDITDIDMDLASGKSNHFAHIAKVYRWLLPLLCFVMGIGFMAVLYPDVRSIIIYLGSWLSFTLYSLKPFRFKTRGVSGLLADACGSHLFPNLFIVSSISYFFKQPVNTIAFLVTGIWSLAYGLRGILWHEFFDRENDLKSGIKTYATAIDPRNFKNRPRVLFVIEITAFAVMLYGLAQPLTIFFLLLYIIMVAIRTKKFNIPAIIVIAPVNQRYQSVMDEYYQIFFPVALLISDAINYPATWLVLVVHVLLFPQNLILVLRDIKAICRRLINYRLKIF